LDTFFEPGEEIIIASSSAEAVAAIAKDRAEVDRIGSRARQRALDCHTADIRAQRLIDLIESPRNEIEEAQSNVLASRGL
jgi:spore maturation protein CgeB